MARLGLKAGVVAIVASFMAAQCGGTEPLPMPGEATTQLEVDTPTMLSTQTPDLDLAAKTKVIRLGNGQLVVVYGDGAGPDVYDVKKRAERPARDLFARTCHPEKVDCSAEDNWTAPVNISNTAAQTSMTTFWKGGDMPAEAFAGDSDKPNIFNNGSRVLVTWVDKYCPGGEQGSVSYLELDNREVPFSCTYVARSLDGGKTWTEPQQLTTGRRDAKQDVHRASTPGWVIAWQEDPAGLQLGEGDGPGEGASGAKVSHGTDIWYTALPMAQVDAGTPFPAPIRVTNNFTKLVRKQGETLEVEDGREGASRPNLAMVGPTVLLAYEETKGSEGVDSGKYVRYHTFPFNAPPTSCEMVARDAEATCMLTPWGDPYPAVEDPARMGCILSNPLANARRVRFFAQGTPGPNSGTKLFMFWKEGAYDGGGPSDIVARRATGFAYADFMPALAVPTATTQGDVPDGCLTREGAMANLPGMNLSTATLEGGDLDAATEDNAIENAVAHRGFIRGDQVVLGYSYTPDWAVATYTDLDHYNFYLRRSTDGGATWFVPVNLTVGSLENLAEEYGVELTGINVREPRIVKTPGHGPGCPTGDPAAEDTTNIQHCSNGKVFLVAWGTQTNVYEHLGGTADLDLFVTRTTDGGATFERVQTFAGGPTEQLESQIRVTPDGREVYLVWNEYGEDTGGNGMFAMAREAVIEPPGAP